MLFFARAALALTLAFSVVGCAAQMEKLSRAYDVVTSATASPKAILVGIQSFDAVKISATGWLRLRRCNGTNGPVCRDPALVNTVDSAIQTGTSVRNDLKAWLRAHPGSTQLGPQALYDQLVAATASIEKAIAVYTTAAQR